MNTIENKETTIKLTEDTNVKYGDLVATVINKPIKEALTLIDMKKDLRILDVVEKAKDQPTFEFDDADLKYIKEQVKKSQWIIRHNDIVEFADYIESL